MGDLWSQPLRDWRRLFGEHNDSLYHMLIQWPQDGWGYKVGFDDPERYFQRIGSMPPETCWRTTMPSSRSQGPAIFRSESESHCLHFQRGYRETEPFRKHIYYGRDPDAHTRFLEMTDGLVGCLTTLPASLAVQLPDVAHFLPLQRHRGFGPTSTQFWMLVVHRLAWRGVPSSSLCACRETWTGRSVLDFDEGTLSELAAGEHGQNLIDRFDGKVPPRHFCSVLPANVFLCSAWAIDLILAFASAVDDAPGRPGAKAKQARMVAHLEDDPPFIALDGDRVEPFDPMVTRYVAELIELNGGRKSVAEFLKSKPGYETTNVTRFLDEISPVISKYVDRGPGIIPCIKVGELL